MPTAPAEYATASGQFNSDGRSSPCELRVRYHLVKLTLGVGVVAGLLLSPKLWLTERHYPHAPVWDGLPTVHAPWDQVVFGGIVLLAGLAAMPLQTRWPTLAFVALAGAWSLWDQSRWQPWFYQYLFMLAALGVAGCHDAARREAGLNACRLIMAFTYVWSGLQKVNVTFATDVYPWIMEPVFRHLPNGVSAWAAEQGWTAALVECGLGVCLLVRPLRALAVPLVVLMHATIFFCLSPWGHHWNSIVWPWNLAMMTLVVVLFVDTRGVKPWHIVWPRRFLFARFALILFGLMPLFSFFGWWDSYLSAALYSGNTVKTRLIVSDSVAEKLPPAVREKHLYGNDLYLFGWAIEEMNVPPYPAVRVYRDIARRIAALDDSADAVTLEIVGRPHWRTGERTTKPEPLDR